MNEELHIWTDGTDTFVARDLEHVRELIAGHYGPDDVPDSQNMGEWRRIEDGELLSIYEDEPALPFPANFTVEPTDARHRFPGELKVTAPASEWVRRAERGGFLCSTEW